MGGPGSGRRKATRIGGRYGLDMMDLSRVLLEPWMARCLRVGTPEALATAEAIRAELATRTWQSHNPYAA